MSAYERSSLDFALRNDFATFIHQTFNTVAPGQRYHPNWHIYAIAWHLRLCATGEIKRLLITVPPRSLKSICGSVAFVAWMLGRDPSARIICASYSADLASKHAQDCRAVMESDWYRRIFPQTRLSRQKNTEMNFETTRHGYRYSTSVGGTLTGRGGNFLITDDPLKSDDAFSEASRSRVNDWYDGTVSSCLDDKREGVKIVLMQRLHLDDLIGHLLQQEKWTHLNLPAIAEIDEWIPIGANKTYYRKAGELLHDAREPKEVLDGIKVTLGSFGFSAQYQQHPVPEEGEIIKWEWFPFYDAQPQRQTGDEVIQSWDTANKAEELSDYSVCTTWLVRGNQYYLTDTLREKLIYPDLKKTIVAHARKHQADSVIIENKGSGISLIDDLRHGGAAGDPMPISFDPEGDKITRMSAQSAQIEAGRVFLPHNAPWLSDFQAELLQFPHGRHDDQIDSVSQFLAWIKRREEVLFSCSWTDPEPTMEELLGQSIPALSLTTTGPVLKPRVSIAVREKNGTTTYMSAEEFAERNAAAVREREQSRARSRR